MASLGLIKAIDRREVLRMRFEQDMTQAEVAAAIGTTEMDVTQIIDGALARIRHAMLR